VEENGSEIERLKKGQMESVQTKLKLEEQVRSLARQIARLESEAKLNVDDEKELLSRLLSVQKELDLVREDAEQKETKSQKHIRRLQLELENLRDHTEKLSRDLHLTEKDANSQSQLLRRQLQESRDQLKQLKSKTFDQYAGSALTTQVEKRHTSELRGLGKQIRYLKAKLFREESFRLDLQYTKNFILMQINCFET
jgi:chromosome segregation ATPase